jgi:hypothetical protein
LGGFAIFERVLALDIAQKLLLTTTPTAHSTGFSFEAIFPAVIGGSIAFGGDGRNAAIEVIVSRRTFLFFARFAGKGAQDDKCEHTKLEKMLVGHR